MTSTERLRITRQLYHSTWQQKVFTAAVSTLLKTTDLSLDFAYLKAPYVTPLMLNSESDVNLKNQSNSLCTDILKPLKIKIKFLIVRQLFLVNTP